MSRPSHRHFAILVIDDDPRVRETVTELLAGDGHHVLSTANGADGLAVARTTHLDLILLDFYMPGMNGLEVARRLKADPLTRRIAVIALTSGTAEHANELSRAGCIGFIPKPFEPTEFLRLVADTLNATVGRRRPGGSDPGL